MVWTVHLCNANGDLSSFAPDISSAATKVRNMVEKITVPVDLDLVVQNIPGRVIPEMGFMGSTLTGDLIHLTLDPGNNNLAGNMGEPFERTIAHEFHHALRFRSVGYGRTLGEALISEGLAGHFCRQLFANTPEIWEQPESSDFDFLDAASDCWTETAYDHWAWFFGTGQYPRWLGYRIGYRMVDAFLKDRPSLSAASLVDSPAEEFRTTLKVLRA